MKLLIQKENDIILSKIVDDDENIVLEGIKTVVGRNGIIQGDFKREGDGATPSGIYGIMMTFGWGDLSDEKDCLIEGVRHVKIKGPKKYFWVDDSDSKNYNKFCSNEEDTWKSAEDLYHPFYKYTIALDYNFSCIPERGSAIFIHLSKEGEETTSGCIAYDEKIFIEVISYLDKDSKVEIVE